MLPLQHSDHQFSSNSESELMLSKSAKRFPRRDYLLVLSLLLLLLFLAISLIFTDCNTPTVSSSCTTLTSLSKFTSFFSSFSPKVHRIISSPFESTKLNNASRVAVCLVGGARRFELTGPSIVKNVLEIYPNFDLFIHSPLDDNSFKFSLLKMAPRIASVKIFQPKPIPETGEAKRVLTPIGSPNKIQGLLQYFNLVEGCLTMIQEFQSANNFTYDYIIRTRVDGYWNGPLPNDIFEPGKYIVPLGNSYDGLNDRFGLGDLKTSTIALSRLTFIPEINSAGFQKLNSEKFFKAQLTIRNISYVEKRVPFCVLSDRRYGYPPLGAAWIIVAAMSSPGPLSGSYCRVCRPACKDECVEKVMKDRTGLGTWQEWGNGTLELCDAHRPWERGWEVEFDRVAGMEMAGIRKRFNKMEMKECVEGLEEMRRKVMGKWEAPAGEEICRLGLSPEHT